MSRKRLENLDPDRQRALFEAAAEEFAAKGFDGASLNRILKKSGMGKSSLYYYFDDKADLFTTLMERTLSVLFGQIGEFDLERLTTETFWSEIEQYYARALSVAGRHDWLFRFGGLFYRLRGDRGHGAPTDRLFQVVRQWVAALVDRGQTLGVLRDDLPDSMLIETTMGLFETLDRWVVAHWRDLPEKERQSLAEVHIGLFRDLLGRK